MSSALRILFLGENWYGSCARACCYALRRLGCDVQDVDIQTLLPQFRRRSSRALVRIAAKIIEREYNALVIDIARRFAPDILLAFKAALLRGDTLDVLRGQGVALYNYYPDTSAFAHGPLLSDALPKYDCVFYTKRFWIDDVSRCIQLKAWHFIGHGYDPEVHRLWELEPRDISRFRHDLVVIATYTTYKEAVLEQLLCKMPELDLAIWGNQWRERCRSPLVMRRLCGDALTGTTYARALRAARINLAITSGRVAGASQGDETTTRTYEIPACGGFMLHERNDEVLELFEEGKEIVCFSSIEELVETIIYYLAHAQERQAIATGGHARCVPAYSYDNRMAELLRWHYRATEQSEFASIGAATG